MALESVLTTLQFSRRAAVTKINDSGYSLNILQIQNQESKEAAEVAAAALVLLRPRSVTSATQKMSGVSDLIT